MSESESLLQDQILKQLSGVTLHRKRVLNPFPHVEESIALNELFAITRPGPKKKKKYYREPVPPAPSEPVPEAPKGMVNYRRERYETFAKE